jgi:hypothetical protein
LFFLTNPGNQNKKTGKPKKIGEIQTKKINKRNSIIKKAKSKLKSGKPKHKMGEIQTRKKQLFCLDFA